MYCVETGTVSLNKYGEELCGDRVEINSVPDALTMVLSDGLGSGVKANILSSLTSKILGTMIANGMRTEDAVQTIAHTLPICSVRHIAYSTFTALHIKTDGSASLIQFDNPKAIYIHEGRCSPYPMKKNVVYGKEIYETDIKLTRDDMLLLISDGVVHAGVGQVYNLGWQYENVCEFVERSYTADTTAKAMAYTLAGACRQLYVGKPGDDATVAVARLREREFVDVMIGPPKKADDAAQMVREFLTGEGKKAVCGGTTSQIVADYLGEKVSVQADYPDLRVPPVGEIKGIDLVTEGVLTINRVLEIIKGYSLPSEQEDNLNLRDGASRLARLLIESSTDIRFFVGTAINPAHQNPEFPLNLALKPRLVQELAEGLRQIGKRVEIKYY